mmetsp:Transcript_33811/g.66514  ORF Transcript_33811/g.66514 Transcript_33811/m.66514 type:complete len:259 (+) Transcript_33811:31-807(+)|eukprot:CAMPEP_0175091610 /NCGR_PEP_ID=MMETSP0086_2-20121207/1998_1 /TAXON_ID=136419 /ORGANISM="Unknown Unknown, Strain D1" /LENGTH=258 /DNA_ID=CAMNT_0016364371 /DNA_START=32 /DNA_END=808 /DNA_ORIENTATION=+
MTKLYFRYGAVGSAKTLNLLAVAHNYEQQGKKCLLVKPEMDVRFGKAFIKSRAGLSAESHYLLKEDSNLNFDDFKGVDCVLVDEAQFLSERIIDQFRRIVDTLKVPIICYGLRTDFRSNLFAGAKRLMELADSIEEVKTTCAFCNKKGTLNLKLLDGKPTLWGPQVCLGMEETYVPSCSNHYFTKTQSLSTDPESSRVEKEVPTKATATTTTPIASKSALTSMELETPPAANLTPTSALHQKHVQSSHDITKALDFTS